jgi:hypothetical protein
VGFSLAVNALSAFVMVPSFIPQTRATTGAVCNAVHNVALRGGEPSLKLQAMLEG